MQLSVFYSCRKYTENNWVRLKVRHYPLQTHPLRITCESVALRRESSIPLNCSCMRTPNEVSVVCIIFFIVNPRWSLQMSPCRPAMSLCRPAMSPCRQYAFHLVYVYLSDFLSTVFFAALPISCILYWYLYFLFVSVIVFISVIVFYLYFYLYL